MISIKSHFLIFLTSSLLLGQVSSTPVPSTEAAPIDKTDQGRQGILEIPKYAATIIRNFIDSNLQNFLNISTPAPLNNVPPELQNSIVGNLVLGNFYATLPPAPAYTPERVSQETVVKPIIISNENSYIGHTKLVEPSTIPPPAPTPPSIPSIESQLMSISTNKPRVKPSRSPDKVHILETDTSVNGIYNSYGVLVSNNPDNEVYWIPEFTRPSIVIPIETSTTPRPITTPEEPEPTESPVETTTEEEEEEGLEVEEVVKE